MSEAKRWLLPALFVLTAGLHVYLAVTLGQPRPTSPFQDVNVYSELAQNIWRDGVPLTRVAERTYPPGYPLVLAPTFSIEDNSLRYAVTYGLHSVLLSLSLLLLLPLLSEALSRKKAWLAITALQFVAGATFAQLHAQSEALFTPLIVATTGVAWLAWARPSARRFVLVGALAGYCLTTRRLGIVVPIALLMVLGLQLMADAEGRRTRLKWLLFAGLGIGLGLLPDLAAMLLRKTMVVPYRGYATGYAEATGKALTDLSNGWLFLQTGARQIAYLGMTTLAAPAFLAAIVVRTPREQRPPEPLQATAAFVGLAALGGAALTTLHIVRHIFNLSPVEGYSVYPRYLDPFEIPLIALGIASAVWLLNRRARVAELLLALAALGLLAGAWYRSRAGRLASVARLEQLGWGDVGVWAFGLVTLGVIGFAYALWRSGRYGTLGTILLAVILSWTLSFHVPKRWVERGISTARDSAFLGAEALTKAPTAPLCVVVPKRGRRSYYEPAFRTDHPVWFVRPKGVKACIDAHPDAFVVSRPNDKYPGRDGTKVVAKDGRWRVRLGADVGKTPPKKKKKKKKKRKKKK